MVRLPNPAAIVWKIRTSSPVAAPDARCSPNIEVVSVGDDCPGETKSSECRPTLWTHLCLLVVWCFCAYLVGRRGVAAWYFRAGSPKAIQTAIAWDPNNSQYYDVSATATHMYAATENPNYVVALYQRATSLSPHDAQLWANLGSGYDWAGRANDSFYAFQRARALFPRSPEINWRLANFCIRAGRMTEGLRALHTVLETDSSSRGRVFALATNAIRDRQAVMDMLPLQAPIFFDYINFAIKREDIVGAEQAWARVLEMNIRFEAREATPYLDALVRHRELTQLAEAWSSLKQRFPKEVSDANSNSNLITNGNFEFDILNGGLDWHVIPTEGAIVSLDAAGALDGGRALRITFDGSRNLDYGHVFEYVLVRPNTKYRFSGHVRIQGISTDSGVKFQVCDAYDPGDLFASTENFVGTRGWSEEHAEFTTRGDTHLLLVKATRSVSLKLDNKIAGTVWVDSVSLRSDE